VVAELQQRHPSVELSGIGGEKLTALGLNSTHPIDRLSVFGIVEPMQRLPELLSVRRRVFREQVAFAPDCFLGIDSPDFNLDLEVRLRAASLKTAHLVSPSVWAWRPGRVKKIARAVDLMLCLLPFEPEFYRSAGVPAVCVGHPMIDDLASLPDRGALRRQFGIQESATVLAVLPGSRAGEVGALMPIYAQTLQRLARQHPGIQFLIPAANPARRQQIEEALAGASLDTVIVSGHGREVMRASDAVLLASGTATLEAMLLSRPMVIAYKMNWLSWQILSRMAITRFVGLPNVLADREVVPELLQEAAEPDRLAREVSYVLEHGEERQVPVFRELAEKIGGNFAVRTADALDGLLAKPRG